MSAQQSAPATSLLLATLDDHAILSVAGEDSISFLQGQTTCDVKALPPGGVTLGAVCNAKGRAVAVFRLLRVDDGCLLVLPTDMVDTVHRRLKPYVLRSRVRIADAGQDGDWAVTGLLGGLGPEVVANPGIPGEPRTGQALHTPSGAWLLGLDRSGKFLLVEPRTGTAALRNTLLAGGLADEVPADRWHAAEIADGIPSVTPATTEEFIPQMLNLDLLGGISFTKGCYTGQEVVARTHYLGAVKRRMHRLRVRCQNRPESGARLTNPRDDASAGQVLMAAPASDDPDRYDLLAVLTDDGAQATSLHLGSSTGPVAEPASLPYPTGG